MMDPSIRDNCITLMIILYIAGINYHFFDAFIYDSQDIQDA